MYPFFRNCYASFIDSKDKSIERLLARYFNCVGQSIDESLRLFQEEYQPKDHKLFIAETVRFPGNLCDINTLIMAWRDDLIPDKDLDSIQKLIINPIQIHDINSYPEVLIFIHPKLEDDILELSYIRIRFFISTSKQKYAIWTRKNRKICYIVEYHRRCKYQSIGL